MHQVPIAPDVRVCINAELMSVLVQDLGDGDRSRGRHDR